jgi:heme A synthase
LEGGIRFEFAHRVLALLVATLTAILAFRLRAHPLPWMRKLGWWTFGTVIAQALLGGALVKLIDPKSLAIAHASLAQICFGLTVAIAFGEEMPEGRGILCIATIFAQAALGAAVRHQAIGVVWHIAGAAAAVGVSMWIALALVIRHLEDGKTPRPAFALLAITALQVLSGIAAYTARAAAIDDPQPMPLTVWTTVAHVVLGALMLGSAIVLAMHSDPPSATSPVPE